MYLRKKKETSHPLVHSQNGQQWLGLSVMLSLDQGQDLGHQSRSPTLVAGTHLFGVSTCCLPGCTSAGSWSRKPETSIKPRLSDMGQGSLNCQAKYLALSFIFIQSICLVRLSPWGLPAPDLAEAVSGDKIGVVIVNTGHRMKSEHVLCGHIWWWLLVRHLQLVLVYYSKVCSLRSWGNPERCIHSVFTRVLDRDINFSKPYS